MKKPRLIQTIDEVIEAYDAFVIDQWGVIHDGYACYPGVYEVLERLQRAGKKAIILTNSSKSSTRNVERLARTFGIGMDRYTALVSSAQVMLDELVRHDCAGSGWGRRAYIVATAGDAALIDATPFVSSSIEVADFVLLLSIAPGETHLDHQDWLRVVVERRLPVLCPSADAQSVSLVGVVSGLQTITNCLASKGVRALNFGKPESFVYEQCERLLDGTAPARILAIGDQLGSDIVGAKRRGYDAVLVGTGAATTLIRGTSVSFAAAVYEAATKLECCPEFILPSLQ